MKKKIEMVLWVIVLVAVLAGLGYYGYGFTKMKMTGNVHPVATFNIKNGDKEGVVKFELYPEYAPNTVTNFIKLIDCGYYDGKIDYGKDEVCMYVGRASGEETTATEKDATAEGETTADATATDAAADTTEDAAVVTTDTESTVKKGDVINPKWSTIDPEVEEDSDADYEYSIKGEFYNNDFKQNTLSHEKWVLSMIRNDYSGVLQSQSTELVTEGYNSGNSQIGIMMSDKSSTLNGLYAGFGRVIEGQEFLEDIYNNHAIEKQTTTETKEDGTEEPVITEEDESGIKVFEGLIKITSASVEKYGVDYGKPEIQKMFDYNQYISDYYTQMYGGGSTSYEN